MKRRWYLSFLYPLFLFLCAITILWATTGTFGLDAGDTTDSAWGAGTINAQRFQNTVATGTLTKLEILFDDATPTGNFRMGVYADDAGAAAGRLLDAGEVAVADGWVSISGLSLAVTLNSYYWLAANSESYNGCRYLSTGGTMHYKASAYGALPDPFPEDGHGAASISYVMRATVTYGTSTMMNSVLIIIKDENKK